eukprot:2275263-Prymnesium_polylepis.2
MSIRLQPRCMDDHEKLCVPRCHDQGNINYGFRHQNRPPCPLAGAAENASNSQEANMKYRRCRYAQGPFALLVSRVSVPLASQHSLADPPPPCAMASPARPWSYALPAREADNTHRCSFLIRRFSERGTSSSIPACLHSILERSTSAVASSMYLFFSSS